MEYYRNEIQITFSPPELEVVRRAVEKFCHFDTPETYSTIPFPELNATRILDKLESVSAEYLWEPSTVKKASAGHSFLRRLVFNSHCNELFARLPTFFERRFSHGWGHKEKRFKASRKGFGNAYFFQRICSKKSCR